MLSGLARSRRPRTWRRRSGCPRPSPGAMRSSLGGQARLLAGWNPSRRPVPSRGPAASRDRRSASAAWVPRSFPLPTHGIHSATKTAQQPEIEEGRRTESAGKARGRTARTNPGPGSQACGPRPPRPAMRARHAAGAGRASAAELSCSSPPSASVSHPTPAGRAPSAPRRQRVRAHSSARPREGRGAAGAPPRRPLSAQAGRQREASPRLAAPEPFRGRRDTRGGGGDGRERRAGPDRAGPGRAVLRRQRCGLTGAAMAAPH